METFAQIAPNIAANCLILLGTAALLFPKTMAAFVGIQPVAPVGISEIRSTLGSFFLGLGATCLWLQSADAFTVLGVSRLKTLAMWLQKPSWVVCFFSVGAGILS
ncbi:hypothetical protein [Trichocoleus sp. FACHB-262]|uniref:hypothetical protein n=1 Tax=Trichocoleus sp. FACHB-262 TaxID=2692869 RepID=UPI001682462B|nr:hypothetical protein [Trichocoleus sp. FACHB-262]MBD2121291.1 hypothetical protein [Trichocoleus sp. FACHB-262]